MKSRRYLSNKPTTRRWLRNPCLATSPCARPRKRPIAWRKRTSTKRLSLPTGRLFSIDPLYYEAGNNLALELAADGQVDEAIQTLARLTRSIPEHVLAFTNLATIYCRQHRYAEAEAVARQAMKQHKYSFKANYVLGVALIDEAKWNDDARSSLEYAQVKYPDVISFGLTGVLAFLVYRFN